MHAAIRAELIANSEPWKLPVMQRFFKEPIDAYCTYTVHVRNIAKTYGVEFASWTGRERMALTRGLWESGKFEEGAVAIQLYARMRRKCEYGEWKVFVRWLEKYVHNWAHCDGLCADVLGPVLIAHPEWVGELKNWAVARQVYKRRAALVAPLKGIRKGLFRAEGEELAGLLAGDREDIIKKALKWLRVELAGRRV
ncbi:MAG: DNA alkylation repair protein [Bryobacteraceae bacterium]